LKLDNNELNDNKYVARPHATHIAQHSQIQPGIQHNATYCQKQQEITRLEEKVKTLFAEHQKLNETLATLNETQVELLKQITNLSSIINTLKWTLTLMVAIFGGLFVFITSEIIKIIT